MTGVDVIPTSGAMNGQAVSLAGTAVAPFFRKLTCHKGAEGFPYASKAYTLSCSVATKTTSCLPFPGISTPARKSGCAYTSPSTFMVKSFPNCCGLTLRGVSVASFRSAPVRALSYCEVVTCASAASPTVKTMTTQQLRSLLYCFRPITTSYFA